MPSPDTTLPGGGCLCKVLLADLSAYDSSILPLLLQSPDLTSCSLLQFTLVDASLAPFFLRLPVLKHYRGFDLPPVRLDNLLQLLHPR